MLIVIPNHYGLFLLKGECLRHTVAVDSERHWRGFLTAEERLKFSNGLVPRIHSVHRYYDVAPVETGTRRGPIFDSPDNNLGQVLQNEYLETGIVQLFIVRIMRGEHAISKTFVLNSKHLVAHFRLSRIQGRDHATFESFHPIPFQNCRV